MSARHIAVIGAGAWGIALACAQARAGAQVSLWMRRPIPAPDFDRTRTLPRLPDIELPPSVTLTNSFPAEADLTLLTVPLQSLRDIAGRLPGASPLIACCKGVETATGALPLQILAEAQPDRPAAMLSGPNFAVEIARDLPAAATIAAPDLDKARAYCAGLATPSFRLYASDDPIGVQTGAAAKNVIAIGAGIAIGAELGENARAALITRGGVEIARLAEAMGGRAATIAGLSGMGDLILTCTGPGSRNFSLGLALGRGETLEDILSHRTTVAEGVATAPALLALARRHGVAMPIVETVTHLLAGSVDAKRARALLLDRPPTTE
ncbi:NAD(P)H-dependent glycerol-3-phosphate dehydrogenase [Acidomonas methanolica]|uniref:NAD(P)H-dependent glycerol-3-phosphate dehydrogenase n=1 Tax=Acidomonas methanolica TaxID=437 RepID=UPI002119E809|nr:NAD(P)H-dependent glycerol-3-phosphate dehydrogenase [Acidomonas methanolica]MCQ9155528.1 NAD(P)-dependent glycerol-3-phosphate dehydrogenase [Acidomonas methanolica]